MKAPITATCPVCGRRYRSPGPAPAPAREPSPAERRASAEAAAVPQNGPLEWFHAPAEPAPVPDVGRGRAARTHRSAGRAGKE